MTVFYIRGLFTYPDEHFHLGPLFKKEHDLYLKEQLQKRGVSLISIPEMYTPHLEEKVQIAQDFILKEKGTPFHLLGHSLGGLVARAVVHHPDLQRHALSVTTLASPHQGSALALFAKKFHKTHPVLATLFQGFGYSIEKKLEHFLAVDPAKIATFNQTFQDLPHIHYLSLIGDPGTKALSPVLKILSKITEIPSPSDGIVPVKAQNWGEPLARVCLDHFSQLGFHFFASKGKRREQEAEFSRMMELYSERLKMLHLPKKIAPQRITA